MELKETNNKITDLKALQQRQQQVRKQSVHKSKKSRMAALLLCFFLGYFGAHRFYVGKPGTAILQIILVACGGIGLLWVIYDLIMIICGKFSDKNEKILSDWS